VVAVDVTNAAALDKRRLGDGQPECSDAAAAPGGMCRVRLVGAMERKGGHSRRLAFDSEMAAVTGIRSVVHAVVVSSTQL